MRPILRHGAALTSHNGSQTDSAAATRSTCSKSRIRLAGVRRASSLPSNFFGLRYPFLRPLQHALHATQLWKSENFVQRHHVHLQLPQSWDLRAFREPQLQNVSGDGRRYSSPPLQARGRYSKPLGKGPWKL